MPNLVVAAVAVALLVVALVIGLGDEARDAPRRDVGWWAATTALHLPWVVVVLFLAGGIVERIGYFWRGRRPEAMGALPLTLPTVCVQLPMYNEATVAVRIIEAATALHWPRDRFSVQVLDDSTDGAARALVDGACAIARAAGVDCRVLRRANRQGYKAGALEAGRRQTDAEFLAIFDADFVPPRDFLLRLMRRFYHPSGAPITDLALVQAQWGHLNPDDSALTRAQALWVDDHHTLQMSWRSARWQFVNFTGTAGIWRAAAIERVGGWRAASLVEDCELSFRTLFAGFRTAFVKEVVAPAELPATYPAYKSQQRRWTQGWGQVQKLHLATLLFRFRSSGPRRVHLAYHMCASWQWAAWGLWIMLLPFLISSGLWFGSLGTGVGLALYALPSLVWLAIATIAAALETTQSDDDEKRVNPIRRLARVVPYAVVNTGMLPHQFTAFTEGLFGPLHGEFERTPKATRSVAGVKVHRPYVVAEAFFVVLQLAWATIFVVDGMLWPALGAAFMALCVVLTRRR